MLHELTKLEMATDIFPWQQALWQQFVEQQQQSLGHAFILQAAAHSGQLQFAQQLAAYCMCTYEAPAGQIASAACGKCNSCHLWRSQAHPDYFLLQAESDSKTIKVEQVRSLLRQAVQTKQVAKRRVIVVNYLQQFTLAASNSLLKYLEEPAADTLFILLADNDTGILPTIRSRCQLVRFSHSTQDPATCQWLARAAKLSLAEAEQLLQAAAGGPLLAQQLATQGFLQQRQQLASDLLAIGCNRHMSSAQFAAQYQQKYNDDMRLFITTWHDVVLQLVAISRGATHLWLLEIAAIKQYVAQNHVDKVSAYLDFAKKLQLALQWVQAPVNKPLLVENLLTCWQQILSR